MGCDFYLIKEYKIYFTDDEYLFYLFDSEIIECIYCLNDSDFEYYKDFGIVNKEILYTKQNKWISETKNVEKLLLTF